MFENFYFFDKSLVPIVCLGILLFIVSIFFYTRNKSNLSFWTLLLGAFCIRIFMSLLDPYLNLWDEQYHALVAKNLILHPLKPTLIENPVIYFQYSWVNGHIWLHKQPLFLWIIALSLKVFGVNEFAVRLPSILMSTIVVGFIFDIGKRTLHVSVGYIAALLFATGNFSLELVSGFFGIDHNDVAFLFFVTGSIYFGIRYNEKKSMSLLIWVGIFSGGAFLVKWVMGLIVYFGWSVGILLNKADKNKVQQIKYLLFSFSIALIVLLPWQIYILKVFPLESHIEFDLNSKHFFEVVEGHGGNALFYWFNLNQLFGKGQLIPFLILFSLFFFFRNLSTNIQRIFFFSIIIFVYAFFTLARTKMSGFCYFMSPIIYLSLGCLIFEFQKLLKQLITNKIVFNSIRFILLFLIFYSNINLHEIQWQHTLIKSNETARKERLQTMQAIRQVQKEIGNGNNIIFNCKPQDHIPFMFYTGNLAYDFIPTQEELVIAMKSEKRIVIFYSRNLPDYITLDNRILIIKDIKYQES